MVQPNLLDVPPQFQGKTLEVAHDQARLTRLLDRVRALMADGHWRTLSEIQQAVGGSEASVSARLRDLRKFRNGARDVQRRRRGDPARGLFEYRVL